VHSRSAVQTVGAVADARKRTDKTRRSPGIANVKIQRLSGCSGARDLSARAFDVDGAIGPLVCVGHNVDSKTELSQCLDHELSVVAPERASQGGASFGECGENERAVGDAF
jgi:hypothetical protein